jgi:hypothetical protein
MRGISRVHLALIVVAVFAGPGSGPAWGTWGSENSTPLGGFVGVLEIDELGFDARLRIRVFHDPGFFDVPASAGKLVLVCADQGEGMDAFFVPTDLAFEIGASQLYPVEFEQASDLFGRALGGRLRPGEVQLGFLILPPAVLLDRYLPHEPDSVTIRYAHHRTTLRRATPEESAWWEETIEEPLLGAALNLWWEWIQAIERAPAMNEGDRRFFAERIFPGQGHVLGEEGMSVVGLRNAILRVGERRLLESRITQRVAPVYPMAARQAGAAGLVVTLRLTGGGSCLFSFDSLRSRVGPRSQRGSTNLRGWSSASSRIIRSTPSDRRSKGR